MNYESLLELVKNRRSFRQFKPDPLPEGTVAKVLEVARHVPSAGNSQPWEFVVVQDQKLKDDLVQILRVDMAHHAEMETRRESWQGQSQLPRYLTGQEIDDFSKAPVFILVFGDTRTNVGLPMRRRFSYDGTQQAYMSGLASALLYMHLAAASLGLSSQWVSSVGNPYAHCLIKDLLGIPPALEVYDMMALGYPGYKPGPRPVRDREEIVHYNYCGEDAFRTDDQVRDFIKKIRGANLTPEQRKPD